MSVIRRLTSRVRAIALALSIGMILCALTTVGADESDSSRGFRVNADRKPSAEDTADWHVFLVSVNDYSDKIGKLQYTNADVQALEKRFLSLNVPPENIKKLIKMDGVSNDFYPARGQIMEQFESFLNDLDSNSIVFVYFSGHGFNAKSGAVEKSYFAPIDFKSSAETYDLSTAICLNDDILAPLSSKGARFCWLCVDACCSYIDKSRDLNASNPMALKDDDLPVGILFQQSCEDGKKAYEYFNDEVVNGKRETLEKLGINLTSPELKHGLFTKSLLEALNGEDSLADANQDERVTLSEIVAYVERRVKEDAELFHSQRQQPRHQVNEKEALDDFILLPKVKGYSPEAWFKARALMDEAKKLLEERDYESAVDKIRSARQLLPKEKDFVELEVDALCELAKEYRAKEDSSLALATINEALGLDPDSAKCKRLKAGIEHDKPVDPPDPEGTNTDKPKLDSDKPQYPLPVQAGALKTFTIAGIETNFRWCPPGEFMMGSPDGKNRFGNEILHKVVLTNGFWLAETETTQRLWQAVMESNPSYFRGDNLPVEQVSWDDCQVFIDRIQQYAPSGMKYCLPSEAHWEYACRARTTTTYSWGDNIDCSMGNFGPDKTHSTEQVVSDSPTRSTKPVMSYSPNPWNLYDMQGNVYEWCQDWYDDYPTATATDPIGSRPGSYRSRVNRGGGWHGFEGCARSADRGTNKPDQRCSWIGFRLELSDASN